MNFKTDSIFVQIPAYRDSQLVPTIQDMLANAYNKKRLNITICWQHAPSEKLPAAILRHGNIRIIDIDYRVSRGANWARSMIQKYWNDERYTFLMDSHLRFTRHWDKKLIEMLERARGNKSPKPVITGFPPSFEDPDKFPLERLNYPVKTYPRYNENGLLTKFYGEPVPCYKWLKEPINADFLAMGFLFADGTFNAEIPFDPEIYFFGDDITTGLRAFCHGYHFFHPHRIIAWHLYNRKTRVPHWDDHKDWWDFETKSTLLIISVLKGRSNKKFPLGKLRTVSDYEKYIGLKLINKELFRH